MKKHNYNLLILVCFILFFSACGINTNPDISTSIDLSDTNDVNIPDNGSITETENHNEPSIESESIAAIPDTGETMTIVWDYFSAEGERGGVTVADSAIAQQLNKRFNVVLDTRKIDGYDIRAQQEIDLASGNFPDIFTSLWFNPQDFINSGQVREIPWDMIEMYAPHYAGMVNDAAVYNSETFSTNESKYTIWSLKYKQEILECFSVYRLDLLEELNITPNGQLVEISDRLFFTDEAFDANQFTEILAGFDKLLDSPEYQKDFGDISAFELRGDSSDWVRYPVLLGMFGLIEEDVVNQQGQPVFWSISDQYRQYLEFLIRLKEDNILQIDNRDDGVECWWNEANLANAFGDIGNIQNYLWEYPEDKLLLTPPEVGPNRYQGVPSSGDGYAYGTGYYIDANVSDYKLAKILEIIDGVSFDPELYALTNFGVEGEDFTWTGTPYDSVVEMNPSSNTCTGLFTVGIMDENAGRLLYEFPSKTLYDFATGSRAKSMILQPYRSGEAGAVPSEDEISLSTQVNVENLRNIPDEYYRAVMAGEKSIAETWDEYIAEMNTAGAQIYAELIYKYE